MGAFELIACARAPVLFRTFWITVGALSYDSYNSGLVCPFNREATSQQRSIVSCIHIHSLCTSRAIKSQDNEVEFSAFNSRPLRRYLRLAGNRHVVANAECFCPLDLKSLSLSWSPVSWS